MKVQVKRFSSHQTAKVFAILMAASSLIFVIPFSLIALFSPAAVDTSGNEVSFSGFSMMFLIMPIFQGVMGYIMVRFGMRVYNKLTPHIGGIEFEFEPVDVEHVEVTEDEVKDN
tara:strand:+ start:47 stop:388 length:342 start_codon:yes stop_codon:yes gene_type:complete